MAQKIIANKNSTFPFLIFFFFFFIYLATSGGHLDVYDGVASFLISENLVLTGSPSVNIEINKQSAYDLGFDLESYIVMKSRILHHEKFVKYSLESENFTLRDYFEQERVEDRYLKDKENFSGPAYLPISIFGAILYHIASQIEFNPIHFVPLFLNSSILAVSCLVVFLLGKELFNSDRIGFVLSLFFGLTSFIWPYITSMYSRPLAILFMLLFIYLIIKSRKNQKIIIPFLAGLSIGLSFLSHYFFFYLLPGAIVFGIFELRKTKKSIAYLILGLGVSFTILSAINYERFGDPTIFGIGGDEAATGLWIEYHKWTRSLEGVYGFLFSPGKSLFLYFPLMLVFPFGLYYLYKIEKSIALLFLYITIVIYVFIATNPEWYSSPVWGPHRYFMPITPLVALSIGSLITKFGSSLKLKSTLIFLAVSGFIVNLLGNLVWIMYAFSYGWSQEGLWKLEDRSLEFTWNPYFSPVLQTVKVLSSDWVTGLEQNPELLNYFKIGLNGCSYDLYLYCEYGIIAILVLGLLISAISFGLIRILKSNYSLTA